jgi:tRNA threonylcarbamoyl adenosine modification protein (Sua5/YciO/YrdC/YwlC family)
MAALVIAAWGDPPPAKAIGLAVNALSGGDIIALPTDTVYGLAADPFHTGAADRLFTLKGRPRSVELPVLVCDEAQALSLCTAVPGSARRLMSLYWPGPLTIVLPRRPDLAADLGEEDATIGIRCPDHPVPLAICQQMGPIATTSANCSGGGGVARRRTGPRPRRWPQHRPALDGGRLHRGDAEGAARGPVVMG